MGFRESIQRVACALHPVERYRSANDFSIRTPPFQSVNPRHRQPVGGEQPVQVGHRTAAYDGDRIAGGPRQAGEQHIQPRGTRHLIRALGDLDQSAVEVEKNGRLRRPGRSGCAYHARTIQRCRAARKSPA